MLLPNSINIVKEQNDNVTIKIDNEKSFNLLSESYLTKQLNSVTVRGKDGSLYYELFYETVNIVTRKDGTEIEITSNDILFDELNQFFFFINNDSGGGGGLTNLPVGNFVFVNTLGNDGTGLREDYAFPFATLNAAKNAAQSGDTIFVFGGTYNEPNPLHKEGVKWHFIGKPVLNLFAPEVWTDSGIDTDIQIQGDAVVNHQAIGGVIAIFGLNTTANINFFSVDGLGTAVVRMQGGSGIINIAKHLKCSLVNRALRFRGNASYTVNCPLIECNSTSGSNNYAVHVHNGGNPGYNGNSIVNAEIIRSGPNMVNGAAVGIEYANMTGKLTINVSKIIERLNASNDFFNKVAVFQMGGNLVVNGDIDGKSCHAINQSGGLVKSFEHNGKAINDGTKEVVYYGDVAGFWSDNNSVKKFNGIYKTSNPTTIAVGSGAATKTTIKGRIENDSLDVGVTSGINILGTAGTVILEECIIIMNPGAGIPESISAAIPKDIKLFHSVGSNANANVNITNLIAANNLIVDANYE